MCDPKPIRELRQRRVNRIYKAGDGESNPHPKLPCLRQPDAEDYKNREPYADQKKEIEHLAQISELHNYKNIESLEKYCKDRLDSFRRAFMTIDYPFTWDNPLLVEELCQNVEYVVETSQTESPRLKKWELCERVLDRSEKSWSELGHYCDVSLAYIPPDFTDHINKLFRQEEG